MHLLLVLRVNLEQMFQSKWFAASKCTALVRDGVLFGKSVEPKVEPLLQDLHRFPETKAIGCPTDLAESSSSNWSRNGTSPALRLGLEAQQGRTHNFGKAFTLALQKQSSAAHLVEKNV